MNLTLRELKSIMSEFNYLSEQLLNANEKNMDNNFRAFMKFINDTEIISNYLEDIVNNGGVMTKEEILKHVEEEESKMFKGSINFGDTRIKQIAFLYNWFSEVLECRNIGSYAWRIGIMYEPREKNIDSLVRIFNKNMSSIFIEALNVYLKDLKTEIGEELEIEDISNKKDQAVSINLGSSNSGNYIVAINSNVKDIEQSNVIEKSSDEILKIVCELKAELEAKTSTLEEGQEQAFADIISNELDALRDEFSRDERDERDEGIISRSIDNIGKFASVVSVFNFLKPGVSEIISKLSLL